MSNVQEEFLVLVMAPCRSGSFHDLLPTRCCSKLEIGSGITPSIVCIVSKIHVLPDADHHALPLKRQARLLFACDNMQPSRLGPLGRHSNSRGTDTMVHKTFTKLTLRELTILYIYSSHIYMATILHACDCNLVSDTYTSPK